MSKTVLLVDDDSSVRAMTGLALRLRGWRVLEAASGEEAIALAEKHEREISLLITDIQMPEMTGTELARTLVVLCPEMKVLFLSGDVENQHFDPGTAVLQKPFTMAVLQEKIYDLLGTEP
jgi:CheY-like chemotaxis protein